VSTSVDPHPRPDRRPRHGLIVLAASFAFVALVVMLGIAAWIYNPALGVVGVLGYAAVVVAVAVGIWFCLRALRRRSNLSARTITVLVVAAVLGTCALPLSAFWTFAIRHGTLPAAACPECAAMTFIHDGPIGTGSATTRRSTPSSAPVSWHIWSHSFARCAAG
jgi:hypothetical protein